MNSEVKAKWLEAFRGGEYKQTRFAQPKRWFLLLRIFTPKSLEALGNTMNANIPVVTR
jgi:hypothetical protein